MHAQLTDILLCIQLNLHVTFQSTILTGNFVTVGSCNLLLTFIFRGPSGIVQQLYIHSFIYVHEYKSIFCQVLINAMYIYRVEFEDTASVKNWFLATTHTGQVVHKLKCARGAFVRTQNSTPQRVQALDARSPAAIIGMQTREGALESHKNSTSAGHL